MINENVSSVLRQLNADLDRVFTTLFSLKELLNSIQGEGDQTKCELATLKEGLKKIECKIGELLGCQSNVQKSVDMTQLDVHKMNDRIMAMQAQIDELMNTQSKTEDQSSNKMLSNDANVALEPTRSKSSPIPEKSDWQGPDRDEVVDKLRSELKQLKEELGNTSAERSFLKELKIFLNEEMEKMKENCEKQLLPMISHDSGVDSLKRLSSNQLDSPMSSEASSLPPCVSRQQSNLSDVSHKSSEGPAFFLGSQNSLGSASIPGKDATTPPLKSSTDPSAFLVGTSPVVRSCGCTCNDRIDHLISSLHKLVNNL